jgi:hypothetical protein
MPKTFATLLLCICMSAAGIASTEPASSAVETTEMSAERAPVSSDTAATCTPTGGQNTEAGDPAAPQNVVEYGG